MMACKAYRDFGRERKGITQPNIVMPTTAHSGFDKAAQYLGLYVRTVPVNIDTTEVDIRQMEKAINRNTVMVCVMIILLSFIMIRLFYTACRISTEFPIWHYGQY